MKTWKKGMEERERKKRGKDKDIVESSQTQLRKIMIL